MSTRRHDRKTLDRRTTASAEPDPRNHEQPPPVVVRDRLRRSVLVPSVLTVPCPDHGADVGEFCTRIARSVCAERFKRRAATR